MDNTFIYLLGFPGVGKYTIAQEIAQQADAVVVDSQLVNMPIFTVLQADGKTPLPPQAFDKAKQVWSVVFDTIVELADPSTNFVLTNALLDEKASDHAWFQTVVGMVTQREGRLLPVRLLCELEENRRRIVSPERNGRLKTIDPDSPDPLHDERTVLNPDYPNTLTLDVTDLSAEDAATRIVEAATGLTQNEPAIQDGISR